MSKKITFHPGRLPNDPTKPRLRLVLDETAVAPPPSADWLHQVPSWPMYLNDRIGDCTFAAVGHMEQAWSAAAAVEVDLPDSAILAGYEAVSGYDPKTGANDNGCRMQDVLNYWRKNGVGGHKILGFAQIRHSGDLSQVRAAIAAFGAVYVGIGCPQSAEEQFNAGEPWTPVAGSPIVGGHAINVGAYDGNGNLSCVTWGRRQEMNAAWWNGYVEEAWVVVTQEWIEANGSTPAGQAVAALGQQYTQMTGQPSPFGPVPEPTPSPTPGPQPGAEADARAAVKRMLTEKHCPQWFRQGVTAWVEGA